MGQELVVRQGPVTDTATVVLTTPEALTPVRREGLARTALQSLTVRELIHCLTSSEVELLGTLPAAQAEAEARALLGIRELLTTEWCEVWAWQSGDCLPIPLDTPAFALAQTDPEIRLDVRPREDDIPPPLRRRRSDAIASAPLKPLDLRAPETPALPLEDVPASVPDSPARRPRKVARDMAQSHGYVRKADWLRAQFLPEVEILDFRGLFVGNKGLWIVEEPKRGEAGAADPAQISDLLLRGNGYRCSGNHVKALMCYQELVELDPNNADFRFLLETTYQAIAAGGSRP